MNSLRMTLTPSATGRRNLLLRDADESDLRRQGFQLVTLGLGDRLVHVGDVPTHAYFPIEGVISIVSSTDRGQSVEVAAVGREGLAASAAVAAAEPSPVDLVVQVAGAAFRLDGDRFRARIEESPVFRDRWLTFINRLMGQMAQSAACNRFHSGRRRLARWLLTVADRAETETIPLTHEFAAALVGGDRPRVSVALRALRERQLVDHRRGQLTIVDRDGLSEASCECYERVRTVAPVG